MTSSLDQLGAEITDLRRQNQVLQHQLFGEKSERHLVEVPAERVWPGD